MSTSEQPAPSPTPASSPPPVPSRPPAPSPSPPPPPTPPPAPSAPPAPSPPPALSPPPAPSKTPAPWPPPAPPPTPAPSPPPTPLPRMAINDNRNTMERVVAVFDFNNFCFFIQLRTGCLIIGYLNLISNLCMFPVMIIGKDKAGAIPSTLINYHTLPLALKLANLVFLLMFLFLSLTCTILLLFGLHKYKRNFLRPFLAFGLFYIVVGIIMFLASFAGTTDPQKNGVISPVVMRAWDIFKHITSILISIYSVLVIRSYYVKMA